MKQKPEQIVTSHLNAQVLLLLVWGSNNQLSPKPADTSIWPALHNALDINLKPRKLLSIYTRYH